MFLSPPPESTDQPIVQLVFLAAFAFVAFSLLFALLRKVRRNLANTVVPILVALFIVYVIVSPVKEIDYPQQLKFFYNPVQEYRNLVDGLLGKFLNKT